MKMSRVWRIACAVMIIGCMFLLAGCDIFEFISGLVPQKSQEVVVAETPAPTVPPTETPIPTVEPTIAPKAEPLPTFTPRPDIPLEVYRGYAIVGYVTLPKVDINLPVTAECDDASLVISAGKFWGPEFHQTGNVVISAHNYRNGTHFGKLKQYQLGDIVTLTDLFGRTESYAVYQIYNVFPDNLEPINQNKGSRELVLLTCSSGGSQRLVVRCRMVEDMYDMTKISPWNTLQPIPYY